MPTIYVKTLDGKTCGHIDCDYRTKRRLLAELQANGMQAIGYQEFRRIKTRILHADHHTQRIPITES